VEETPGPKRPTAGAAAGRGRNATAGATNIPDKRVKELFATPDDAAKQIPELRELSKLISASPAVSKLLKDKNLVATIFAPNNAAVKAALAYVNSAFPNVTTKELGEMGIIDSLLQYHVTAGKAALTSDRLKANQKLTMLNNETTTIVKAAAAAAAGPGRRLLQVDEEPAVNASSSASAATWAIRSNTNQTVPIQDVNYQGGKAIIHIIDGVLIPDSLAKNFSLTDIPGASNETLAEAPAPGANDTAAEPAAAGGDNRTGPGPVDASVTKGPSPSPAPAPKSSAGTVVASLLAVPTLLAVLML